MPRVTVACNESGLRIGQDHHNAKLTDHEVDTICEMHATGSRIIDLARMFEVSKGTVHDIVSGRRRAQVATRWRTIIVPG